MLRVLPNPVLAVTHDVLRDVDGDDALSSLWFRAFTLSRLSPGPLMLSYHTVFTKAKGGLLDGERLENISWRLWHRELADSHSYRPLTPESPADGTAPATFTGSHPQGKLHDAGDSELANSLILAGPISRIQHIGKVIDEISLQAIALRGPEPRSHIPTPTTEPVSIAIYTATDTPQRSPSRRTAADSEFPRVVVVNPTPNLTPHPTPPATPVLPSAPVGPLHNHSSVSPLPPPRSSQRPTTIRQTMPATTASLKPSDVKFFTGSPSSSSTSSDSSTSSASTDNSPEETQPSSSTTTTDIPPSDIPPSLCRTETLPATLYDADKVSQSIARNVRRPAGNRAQKVATHARMPSVKDRASLEAEDRALAEQQQLEQNLETKQRREQEERQKLITWEREMELERQRRKEREQEDKRREEREKELQKLREAERLKELERAKLQAEREGLFRRTASTGRLPTQDTAIFDFTEEAQNDTQHHLQPSGSSHPELARTAFGLNRALSPPKASTSSAAATKNRNHQLLPSAPNLQALASQKAAMRMQSTLKGAFTPVHRGSPTKSESSKASSSRNSKQPSSKTHPNAPPPNAPAPSKSLSKPPAPPSLKGKEKEKQKQKQHLTRTGRPFELLSSDEEEEDGEDDDDWTSADEVEEEVALQASVRTILVFSLSNVILT